MSAVLRAGIQAAWVASLHSSWRRFQRAAADPERAQQARLQKILAANADTAYGREHGFQGVCSVAQFQSRTPVVTYDAMEPWIQRVADGEPRVLTAAPVHMLERSGGSTTTNKLIPYTAALLEEFSAATGAWLYDLHRNMPSLWGTRSYWSVSPATRGRETTPGGIPIGFEDDTEYFSPVARWALRQMMAVPGEVARLPDMAAWRRTTLRHLLAAEDLGLISVWSPTFLTVLMQHLESQLETLLGQLAPSRARAVAHAVARRGKLIGEDLWPRLALISCWTDSSAAGFLPALRRWFPHVRIQPKGLLATEGVVSIPLTGRQIRLAAGPPGAVAAVSSHFLEFLDVEHPQRAARLAHALRPGAHYSPLLTTAGGLYRYHLQDVVQCVGRYRRTPLLRFVGKLDRVSDLCGEKLNARQVDHALDAARRELGAVLHFALLAPRRSQDGTTPPRYVLYVESPADDRLLARVGETVERHLATGHHYRYCLELGQLAPLEVRRVENGWQTYERTLRGLGSRAGDIKPTSLDVRDIWAGVFG